MPQGPLMETANKLKNKLHWNMLQLFSKRVILCLTVNPILKGIKQLTLVPGIFQFLKTV